MKCRILHEYACINTFELLKCRPMSHVMNDQNCHRTNNEQLHYTEDSTHHRSLFISPVIAQQFPISSPELVTFQNRAVVTFFQDVPRRRLGICDVVLASLMNCAAKTWS